MASTKNTHSSLQILDCEFIPVPPGTKSKARMLRGSEWAIPGILADILTAGLQRIAAIAQGGDPRRCAIEADHLRHLPALLAEFNAETLDHYWNAERTAYIGNSTQLDLETFEPMWADLAEVFQARKEEIASGRG